jgi:hypothetical protein
MTSIFNRIKKSLFDFLFEDDDENISISKTHNENLSETKRRIYKSEINRIEEQKAKDKQLSEYLAEQHKREKEWQEKYLVEIQEKRQSKEIIIEPIRLYVSKRTTENEITKPIRPLGGINVVEQIKIGEISLCTCDTTPDDKMIKCGYCGKLMCQYCWNSHRYSHGRPMDSISITYHSNGNVTGKP